MKVCAVHEAGVFGGPARRIIEVAKALKKYKLTKNKKNTIQIFQFANLKKKCIQSTFFFK